VRTYDFLRPFDPSIEIEHVPLLASVCEFPLRIKRYDEDTIISLHGHCTFKKTRTETDEIDICIIYFPIPFVEVIDARVDGM